MLVSSAAVPAPPAPPPAPPILNTGTYDFLAANLVDTSAPGATCCALSSGSLRVPSYAIGARVVVAQFQQASASGCRTSAAVTAPTTATHTVDAALQLVLVSGDKYEGTVPLGGAMGGQPFLFTIEAGRLDFANTYMHARDGSHQPSARPASL